jgi:hypothetical protein
MVTKKQQQPRNFTPASKKPEQNGGGSTHLQKKSER